MLGRKKRRREHEGPQDLDPRGSPHIEEKVIGGNVDLDLLSLSTTKLARIHGGIEIASSNKVDNGGRTRAQRIRFIGEEDPLL